MIWTFEIEYRSGRTEKLTRESNAKAKALEADLTSAVDLGSVVKFRKEVFENKEAFKAGSKRASAVHMAQETRERIQELAQAKGVSFSSYVNELAEAHVS